MRLYDIHDRRHWHRQDPVLAADGPLSFVQFRNYYIRNPQIVQADRSSYNVHDGVHCAHFMKMHLIFRHSMGFRFRLCQNPENLFRRCLRTLRQIRMRYDMQNFRKSSVPMHMAPFVVMRLCFVMSMPMDITAGFLLMMSMGMQHIRFLVMISMGMHIRFPVMMPMGMHIRFLVMMPMSMHICFLVMMSMNTSIPCFMAVIVSVQILHIMIMVLISFIQNHIKITHIKS